MGADVRVESGKKPFIPDIVKYSSKSGFCSLKGLSPGCLSTIDVLMNFPVSRELAREAKCARFGMVARRVPFAFSIPCISLLAFLWSLNARCSMTSRHNTRSNELLKPVSLMSSLITYPDS